MTALVVLFFLAPLSVVGWLYWELSNPAVLDLPLPESEVALQVDEGQRRLAGAEGRSDLASIQAAFQTQQKGSWCGVASAVIVLNAGGAELTQDAFFTAETEAVRTWTQVTFGGMSLDELAGLLEAHGAEADAVHAATVDVETFRSEVARNLATEGDWLLVNYDRTALGEEGGGHISPLSAFDADTDSVLLQDTASYKYPPHWVPIEALHAAMAFVDPAAGRSRGWVVVR